MNGGQIIAKVLQDHGVKFLFTLCGGHISPIFVEADNIGIRVIDTRHEANAVFAADAVSRLTGIPGVVTVTAGPGVTNTITAVKNAFLAQSPLIVLGGAAATILKGRGALQDIDQMAMMKPNVKWAVRITKVKDIFPTLNKAFEVTQEGVPGPVFIECPIDVLYPEDIVRDWYGAKSKETAPRNTRERLLQWYINWHAKRLFDGKDVIHPVQKPRISFPSHSSSELSRTVDALQKSKKPLMIIGSGAMMRPEKANELSQAVSNLGIPVYLSGIARGLLGKEHPLQKRHKRKLAIKDADLIVLAGVPNDFRLDYGSHIGHRKFVSINRSKEDLYKNKKPSIAIHSDPGEFLIALSDKYRGNHTDWNEYLSKRGQEREEDIDKRALENVNGINPLELFRKLDPLLSDNTILVADGGDFVATASYTLRPRSPLSWLDPGVFGTLGVGAGFALGAKLVFPEKDVWIVYGDGSAGYSLMENDTFVRHRLPVISLIGNDACWTQIARDQVDFLGSDCALNLSHSDYQIIGSAFGAEGAKVENINEFTTVVKTALEKTRQGTPFIINAIIGKTNFRKGSISV